MFSRDFLTQKRVSRMKMLELEHTCTYHALGDKAFAFNGLYIDIVAYFGSQSQHASAKMTNAFVADSCFAAARSFFTIAARVLAAFCSSCSRTCLSVGY